MVWVIGVAMALGTGCGEKPASSAGLPPCCRALQPAASFTDGSLYQLNSEWTSDAGKTIRLGVLEGRPQIVTLFFTHCEFTCPLLLHDLRRIESALPAALRERVDFLLISLDAERDTPAALHAYRQTQQLPVSNWTLLRGEPGDVLELAALLGVNYQRDARGQFAHSNMITLLNARGEIAFQLPGVNSDITPFIRAVERLFPASP